MLRGTQRLRLQGIRLFRALSSDVVTSGPSLKTSVLLRRLPLTLTEDQLKVKLQDVNVRKIELEPGCSIHVTNEAAAVSVSSFVTSEFNCQVKISFFCS